MFSGMWDHHPDPEEWNKYSETPAPNPQDIGRSSGLVPSSVFHPHTFAVKMPDIFPVSLGDIPILADVILSHVKSRYVQIAGGCWWGCYGSCRTSPFPQHVFVQGSNEFPDAILLVRWPPQEPVVLGMPGDAWLRFWIRTVVHMTVYDLQT